MHVSSELKSGVCYCDMAKPVLTHASRVPETLLASVNAPGFFWRLVPSSQETSRSILQLETHMRTRTRDIAISTYEQPMMRVGT